MASSGTRRGAANAATGPRANAETVVGATVGAAGTTAGTAAGAVARRASAASSAPPNTAPPRVGEQIQRLRAERRMTLDDLSRAAGVSKSMLSEIERDKANPTIAVAWRLTNALGVSLDSLFAPPRAPEAIAVSGPHEIPTLSGHDAKYQLRVWGPIELAGKFEWYELTLQPGGALVSNAHEPGTREHLTVLHGSIEIDVAGATKRLKAADTARYVADEPHAIRNAGKGEAKALLVVIHG